MRGQIFNVSRPDIVGTTAHVHDFRNNILGHLDFKQNKLKVVRNLMNVKQ